MEYNILADLRRQRNSLNELQDLIDNQKKFCETEPNSFAYELALQSLQAQKDTVVNRISKLESDYNIVKVDLKINSPQIAEEIVPVNTLANVLLGFQNLINSVAQAIHGGLSVEKGPIANEIVKSCQLNLTNTYAGSFGMQLEGLSQSDMLGKGLLSESLSRLGTIFETGDETEKLLEQFGDLGGRTVHRYKDWLNKLEISNVSLDLKWLDETGLQKAWQQTPTSINKIRKSLDDIKEISVKQVTIEGALMGASLIRDRFEFICDNSEEKINGKVIGEIRPLIQKFFGKKCIAILQKEVLYNNATDTSKATWTLLKLADLL